MQQLVDPQAAFQGVVNLEFQYRRVLQVCLAGNGALQAMMGRLQRS